MTETHPPKRRRWLRIVLPVVVCAALVAPAVIAVESVAPTVAPTAIAAAGFGAKCVAGMLSTGLAFIGVATAIPTAAVIIFGYSPVVIDTALTYRECQTGWLGSYMKNILAQRYSAHAYWAGVRCDIFFRCVYVYAGVGTGSGGGSSGGW